MQMEPLPIPLVTGAIFCHQRVIWDRCHLACSLVSLQSEPLYQFPVPVLNKLLQTYWFKTTQIYFLTVLDFRNPKSRCWLKCVPFKDFGSEYISLSFLASRGCLHSLAQALSSIFNVHHPDFWFHCPIFFICFHSLAFLL